MKLKTALHLILILDILLLAGAAAGQAAAPISVFDQEKSISNSLNNLTIDEVFLKNEYLQVKYIFKIIEVSRETKAGIRLNKLFYNNSEKGSIDFYNQNQVLEFLDPVSLNNLKIEYAEENNFNYLIYEPEIIVSLFERASIEVNEEILNITDEDETFKSENKLYLSLFTKNISKDKHKITTEFILETKDNTVMKSTLNIFDGKESLVGFLVFKNINNINITPSQSKLYVVYLKAISLKKLTKSNNQIINLDGLDNIVSSDIFASRRNHENYILFFSGEKKSLKSKIIFKNDFAFYLGFKENKYMMVSLDRPIFSELNLELNIYTRDEKDYFLSLGVNEEIVINPYFSLGAGVYPVVYGLKSEKYEEYFYWINTQLFVLNDKNKISIFYQKRNDKEDLRLEIGREIWKNIEVIAAKEIIFNREEAWELGLKWKF